MAQPLDIAMEHHRAGRLAEAEAAYRQLLTADPRNPQVLHLLGMVVLQQGKPDQALPLLRSAAMIAPKASRWCI